MCLPRGLGAEAEHHFMGGASVDAEVARIVRFAGLALDYFLAASPQGMHLATDFDRIVGDQAMADLVAAFDAELVRMEPAGVGGPPVVHVESGVLVAAWLIVTHLIMEHYRSGPAADTALLEYLRRKRRWIGHTVGE